MFTRILVSAFLACLGSAAVAAPETYVVDPRHTFPSFEVKHFDFSFQRGRFNATKGTVVLDLAAKQVAVDIAIDAASVDTGLDALETHLRKSDFLDVEKHPFIVFKSTGSRFNGEMLVALNGDLTIRGVTRPVTLDVSSFRCGVHPVRKRPTCGAEAAAMIKRSEFGITYGLAAVADDMKLLINVEAMQP